MASDQSHWHPVLEAAGRLGVSENALRKRIRRNTIEWAKDNDGRIVVHLDEASTDQATNHPAGQSTGQFGEQATDQALFVESLQDQVRYLREQLDTLQEQSAERDRENRRIIAALTQRIPAIEAGDEQESPQTASGEPSDTQAPQEEEKRSWWRRLFG
jgi:capsule polysaccharide export protein KpsE/RkpR